MMIGGRRDCGKKERKKETSLSLLFLLPITSPVRVCGVYRKLVAGSIPPSSSSSRASAASAAERRGETGAVGVGVFVFVACRRLFDAASSSPSSAAACRPPFLALRLVAGAMIEILLSARLDLQVGARREVPGRHKVLLPGAIDQNR